MKQLERGVWRILHCSKDVDEQQRKMSELSATIQASPWPCTASPQESKDWGSLMASLPDRFSASKGFFSAPDFASFWAQEVWSFVSVSSIGYATSLVMHLLKRGLGETLCKVWTRNLLIPDVDDQKDKGLCNLQNILKSLDASSVETLLLLFIKSLQRARQAREIASIFDAASILSKLIPSSDLGEVNIGQELLVERLLLGRLLAESSDTLHLLIHCITLLPQSILSHTLKKTIESWAHPYILDKQALTSQLNYSRVLLLLTGHTESGVDGL
jgi:hypothetical protein